MLRGIFVTGTDTNVGKTIVCAALLQGLRYSSSIRYWKPIQTGVETDDDTATVLALSGREPRAVLAEGIRLPLPLSPHLAARLAGIEIGLDSLVERVAAQPASDRWIVEGAGGLLVPINTQAVMADLIGALGLPALVVARTSLGTINHTLLTLEGLRSRAIAVAGVVMVGDPNRENLAAIERYGRVPVLGELPWIPSLTADSLQRASASLDRKGELWPHFE